MNPRCFKLHRSFYSTSCNLSKLANFSGIELYRTASKFRKRKRKLERLSITFKVMLHETIPNDDFYPQQSAAALLRHCFESFQHCSNVASLYCTKIVVANRPGVTSPLRQTARVNLYHLTCRFLFIIATHKLVVSRHFYP